MYMQRDIDGIHEKPKSKIDAAKEKLYSNNFIIKEKDRARLHADRFDIPDTWEAEKNPEKLFEKKTYTPLFRKFFIGAVIFFVIAILVAAFSVLSGRSSVSTDAIEVTILTKSFVDGGQALDVIVEVKNNNPAALELADLVLEYPKSATLDGEVIRDRRSLGTIAAGGTSLQNFEVFLFGEEGSERLIRASLEYRVENSNAIFSKESESVVAIQSTPLQVAFEAPASSVAGQPITFDVVVTSQSTETLSDMLFAIEYPNGFTFIESSPAPDFGNHTWNIGSVESGSEKIISVTGVVEGVSGEVRVFRAFVGRQNPEQERQILTTFNSALHTLQLENSFFALDMNIGNKTTDRVPVNSGENVPVTIFWENTLSEALTDVTITARLSGSGYSRNDVSVVRGFFNSTSNAVVWDSQNDPQLAQVNPGAVGNLSFQFKPLPLISGNSVIDQPEILIQVSVTGLDPTGGIRSAEAVVQKTALVNSDLQLTQQTLYYGGSLSNTGPYPPQVGQKTTFSVVWSISNSSNPVNNANVVTTLPSYVEWVGNVSPSSEDLSYNSVRREITWNINQVEKGAGFSAQGREVAFQLSITPSFTQINQSPELTSDVVLIGEDQFTDVILKIIRRPHSTKLLNDVQSNAGRVIQ
jgi:hypothetical protein